MFRQVHSDAVSDKIRNTQYANRLHNSQSIFFASLLVNSNRFAYKLIGMPRKRIMRCDISLFFLLITAVLIVAHFYISQYKRVQDKLETNVLPVTMAVHVDSGIEVSHIALKGTREEQRKIITTLCTDKKCSNNCTQYDTPVSQCYNGRDLGSYPFYDNTTNPFGIYDTIDVIFGHHDPVVAFKRSFFGSTNGSCTGSVTDLFDYIPLDECVGPFGPPRPCGTFHLVADVDDPHEEIAMVSS